MLTIDSDLISMMDKFHDPQVNPSNRDDRNIDDYDKTLKNCAEIEDISSLLAGIHPEQEEITWIDYCCGQGIALVEGTKRVNRKGLRKVSSLGVDLRIFEKRPYLKNPKFVKGRARFYQHDLDSGIIKSLAPDFITCIKGLLYVKDPLKNLEAMYKQLREGGYILVTVDTSNTVDYHRPLGMEIMDTLRCRRDVIAHACLSDEMVLLFNKPVGGTAELGLGLTLESRERDPKTGWTKCNYQSKEVLEQQSRWLL